MSSGQLTRRTIVTTGLGAAAAIPILAACGSDTPTAAATSTAAAATSTAAAATSTAAAATSTAAAANSGSSSDGALATLADIAVGSAVAASLNGAPICIARPTDTTAVAFSAICTHKKCTVAPKGGSLDCPCHGSKYDALTGAVTNGPATQALATVAVAVKDGKVVAA